MEIKRKASKAMRYHCKECSGFWEPELSFDYDALAEGIYFYEPRELHFLHLKGEYSIHPGDKRYTAFAIKTRLEVL